MATKYRLEHLSSFHGDIVKVAEDLEEYPSKASRIFAKVDEATLNLLDWPEIHQVYLDLPSYRYIVIEDYIVLYKFHKQTGLIEVHRLLYGGMDIPAHMR